MTNGIYLGEPYAAADAAQQRQADDDAERVAWCGRRQSEIYDALMSGDEPDTLEQVVSEMPDESRRAWWTAVSQALRYEGNDSSRLAAYYALETSVSDWAREQAEREWKE